jgi:signal transduction histidine kinase
MGIVTPHALMCPTHLGDWRAGRGLLLSAGRNQLEITIRPAMLMKSGSSSSRFPAWRWRGVVAGLGGVLLGGWVGAAEWDQGRGPGPATKAQPTDASAKAEAALGIGKWIWTTNFAEKQVCRLWRSFTLPSTNAVRKANLRLTADNLYRLYLNGREIGQGGNWRSLTDYDVTWLLQAGAQVLAVEALNDTFEGGVILGLNVEFMDGSRFQLRSDKTWYVVPEDTRRWTRRRVADPNWERAQEVGVLGQFPWWLEPVNIVMPPPLRPEVTDFWQTGWFLALVLSVAAVAVGLSVRLAAQLAVQTRAQKLLERERTLIARDIHDDLGAGLTQLVLQGEVAQTEFPAGSPAHDRLNQMSDKARAVSRSLEEVLWAVNSKRDTLRDFTSYLCKYAQSFLSATPIRCRLDVQPDMPSTAFDLPVRRSLFLAVKEALHNAAKYSGATELFLRIRRERDQVLVVVEDNGRGFDATLPTEGNGLGNMQQRLAEMGGACEVISAPGAGCRVEFNMPLAHPIRRVPWWKRLFQRDPPPITDAHPEP